MKIIEWKHNLYNFTKTGANVSSSLLSLTFIDKNNQEIPLPNSEMPTIPKITLYIPLQQSNRSNELLCVWYDHSKQDFDMSGCAMVGAEGDKGICETDHLTDFGILNTPYKELIPPVKRVEVIEVKAKVDFRYL
eukprot:TRINITY_DN10857_c0_g6_i3.p2 TRINITY_DN10857_c0_g6~~TRINITY_DN10857_c0_g6_i3.p2  ORF type:complete len:134 (-),score=20.07 TRINITY_DN10857_c0_g6_i3:1042-1443(-)